MRILNSALAVLAASDVAKTLVAAPSGGVATNEKAALRIHRIVYKSKTANANAIVIACGATEFGTITNLAANGDWDTGLLEGGILCPAETALIATPAAAGPAGYFYVDYSID